jgi:membrane associated rhomboid family serine protease
MTWLLIGLNVAAFVYQLTLPPEVLEAVFYRFGMVPARWTDPEFAAQLHLPFTFLPVVTSMFLHGGFLHIVSNLWTLWIFGDNVEDRMGPIRFLAFYLLSGVAAAAVHWATNLHSTVPTIGASGAIAGVLGAYLLLYPRARVVTMVPILFYPLVFELPAVIYLGFWFVLQLWSGVAALDVAGDVGGIAFWAHVGGFLAGMLLLQVFKRRDLPPPAAAARHYVYGRPAARRYYRF